MRIQDQSCGGCRYWESLAHEGGELGQCRKNPPVIVDALVTHWMKHENPMPVDDAIWCSTNHPMTTMADWCGEWKEA